MLFVIRMLRIGWRVQAKRDLASFPNEWAILRPSANGTTWKHLLEKKVRVGLRFGARLALPRRFLSSLRSFGDPVVPRRIALQSIEEIARAVDCGVARKIGGGRVSSHAFRRERRRELCPRLVRPGRRRRTRAVADLDPHGEGRRPFPIARQ